MAAADGSSWHPLTDQPAYYGESQWSPDGRWLAFNRSPGPSGAQGAGLCRVSADGGPIEHLTTGNDAYPAWSPTGDCLVFTRFSEEKGTKEFIATSWLVNADGSGLTQLTVPPMKVYNPAAWSPDGPRILFSAILNEPGNISDDIWVVSPEGGEPVKLPGSTGLDGGAGWSPDGGWIAFTSWRDERNGGLYLMDADGGQVHRFIPGMTGCNTPTWSADGTYLGFTTGGIDLTGGMDIVELLDPSQGITGPVINATQGMAKVNAITTRVVWAPR